MIEQNTTLKPGDLVVLKQDVESVNLRAGCVGRVIKGFAGLLAVEFDEHSGEAYIQVFVDNNRCWMVNLCELAGTSIEK